jgi:hypothetical protein
MTTGSSIDSAGHLKVAGTINPRARGTVRIRFEYARAVGAISSLLHKAPILHGEYALTVVLPREASVSGGELSIKYTGDKKRRIAGGQLAVQVSPR